jgi:hypothetical protein
MYWAECAEEKKIVLTSSSGVLTTLTVGLLNSEAATERPSYSGVAAADGADVTSGGADAVELVRHGNTDGEILLLSLGQTVGTRDVVGNLELGELSSSVAGLIKITLVRTGTISVDLVNGDSHDSAGLDRSHTASGQLVLGLLADIDVAVDLSASARVDDVLRDLGVADDGGILLARRDGGAVTSKVLVDCGLSVGNSPSGLKTLTQETLTGALFSNSLEDDAMGLDSGGESD